MTFEFVPTGLRADGTLIICVIAFGGNVPGFDGDEMREQAGLVEGVSGTAAGDGEIVGSSGLGHVWRGRPPREAEITLTIMGPDRGDALRLLLGAHGGDAPQEHRLVGDRTGGAFPGPVRISAFRWDWPQVPDMLQVRMTFRELKPEVANARTAPVPTTPRAVDPAPPVTVLNQPDLVRLSEVERALADAYTPGSIVETGP